jgi:hypothetical protein
VGRPPRASAHRAPTLAAAAGAAAPPAASGAASRAIWSDDEVPVASGAGADAGGDADAPDDGRARPVFEVKLVQRVGAEDAFGLSGRDASAASCDSLVVRVQLPGERLRDVECDVTRHALRVLSPRFRLATYLPHAVRAKDGRAEWDAAKHELVVRVPVLRADPITGEMPPE